MKEALRPIARCCSLFRMLREGVLPVDSRIWRAPARTIVPKTFASYLFPQVTAPWCDLARRSRSGSPDQAVLTRTPVLPSTLEGSHPPMRANGCTVFRDDGAL